MPKDLRGKTIVITGASAGIGAATAVACAAAGMRVVVGARRLDRLQEVAARCNEAGQPVGGQAVAVRCDVAVDEDVAALVREATTRFGSLDAIFANAGYGADLPINDITTEQVRRMFEVNLIGTLRCIWEATPIMKARGSGHILVCTSAASEFAPPRFGIYAATKSAQDSVVGALRAELHGSGIEVTGVHPVGTKTEFFETAASHSGPDREKPTTTNTPESMMQTPEHVAKRVVDALRRPRPEVWPNVGTRFGLALLTAFPALTAMVGRNIERDRRKEAGQTDPHPAPPGGQTP